MNNTIKLFFVITFFLFAKQSFSKFQELPLTDKVICFSDYAKKNKISIFILSTQGCPPCEQLRDELRALYENDNTVYIYYCLLQKKQEKWSQSKKRPSNNFWIFNEAIGSFPTTYILGQARNVRNIYSKYDERIFSLIEELLRKSKNYNANFQMIPDSYPDPDPPIPWNQIKEFVNSVISGLINRISNNERNNQINSESIETNSGVIETNSESIETNSGVIETNSEDIETNSKDIETNSKDIETNSEDIETNSKDISVIEGKLDSIPTDYNITQAKLHLKYSKPIIASQTFKNNFIKSHDFDLDFLVCHKKINWGLSLSYRILAHDYYFGGDKIGGDERPSSEVTNIYYSNSLNNNSNSLNLLSLNGIFEYSPFDRVTIGKLTFGLELSYLPLINLVYNKKIVEKDFNQPEHNSELNNISKTYDLLNKLNCSIYAKASYKNFDIFTKYQLFNTFKKESLFDISENNVNFTTLSIGFAYNFSLIKDFRSEKPKATADTLQK